MPSTCATLNFIHYFIHSCATTILKLSHQQYSNMAVYVKACFGHSLRRKCPKRQTHGSSFLIMSWLRKPCIMQLRKRLLGNLETQANEENIFINLTTHTHIHTFAEFLNMIPIKKTPVTREMQYASHLKS